MSDLSKKQLRLVRLVIERVRDCKIQGLGETDPPSLAWKVNDPKKRIHRCGWHNGNEIMTILNINKSDLK